MSSGLIRKRAPAQAPPADDIDSLISEAKTLAPDEFEIDKIIAQSPVPQGELGFGTRAKLSFMSNEQERRKAILQDYPGAKFSTWKDKTVVLLPGENSPRYIDDPSWIPTMADVADFAGDITGMAGGIAGAAFAGPASIPGAMAGAAAGEAARKAIGRELILGEDAYNPDTVKSDAADVAISAGAGGIGQFGANKVTGFLRRQAQNRAASEIGKNTGKKALAQSIEGTAGEPGQFAVTSGGQAAATQAEPPPVRINAEITDLPTEAARSAQASAPKNLDDLAAWHKVAEAKGQLPELPSAERLREVVRLLPDLEHKPLGAHYEMLKSRQNFDVHRVHLRTLPGQTRVQMDAYEQKMKNEITEKVGAMIDGLGNRPKLPKAEAGNQLMADVSEIYKAEKKRLGPLFEELKKTPIPEGAHESGLINRLAERAPGFGQALQFDNETGKLAMGPFRPDMGISRKAYTEMRQVVNSLNQESLSFQQMQRIREYLRKQIDPAKPGETQDLQAIRGAMLDHMEDLISANHPSANVRATFKQYAKNERLLEDFEKILGGKVEDFNALYLANPDQVLNRVFTNPNTVSRARELLGNEKFANLTGDFLNELRERAFDSAKNSLSVARFARELKMRKGVLEAAIGKEQYERLRALADLGKIIPDAEPINPSGTAKTGWIMQRVQGAGKAVTGTVGLMNGQPQAFVEGLKTIFKGNPDARAEKAAIEYIERTLQGLPGEDRRGWIQWALDVFPDIPDNKAVRTFLQSQSSDLGRKLLGPATEGLIRKPKLQGPAPAEQAN